MKKEFTVYPVTAASDVDVRCSTYDSEAPSDFLISCIQDGVVSAMTVLSEFMHYCSESDISKVITQLGLDNPDDVETASQLCWPFKMEAEYEDGTTLTVSGNDEDECMHKIAKWQDAHGECVYYAYANDENYVDGECMLPRV